MRGLNLKKQIIRTLLYAVAETCDALAQNDAEWETLLKQGHTFFEHQLLLLKHIRESK